MISEDYCSFEVAKLLKEKGFYQDFLNATIPVWKLNGSIKELAFYGDDNYPCEWEEWYSAPTHQMATAYVRKTYNIFIRIGYNRYYKEYSYDIFSMDIDNELAVRGYNFKTYKDAVDAALKEVLENII